MATTDHRLTTRQMAEFVANGFLRFDGIVPADINERGIEEMRHLELERFGPDGLKPPHTGTPLDECYPPPSAIGEYLRLPQIRGIIQSFVGPDPTFDHDFTHHLQPHSTYLQPLHVDAITDSPDTTFDVQLFWYPHDVAPGEGGTRFVPGSHLRRVRSSGLDRYQHIVGEQQFSGPAGTVVVFHHGLWHAGQPNPGDRDRWMHKVRLNPTVAQVRLWNTADFDQLQNRPSDHVFARMQPDSVAQILRTMHPWMSITDYRNEQVQRTKLWRYLTGDETYDVDHYLTRLEGRAALGRVTMNERQQVLYLWANGSALDSGTVGWAFHDGTDGTGPSLPDATPPYADGVAALRDGWMLLQSSQLTAPLPGNEHLNDYLDHEFVFERRITSK